MVPFNVQVLAGAQLDPEQLSGRKLSDTITQLLGSYDELNPSPAQVSEHTLQLKDMHKYMHTRQCQYVLHQTIARMQ